MKRDISFDVAKGIGILLVIIGHCVILPNDVRNIIYSFHMPMFFFIGGHFYRKKMFCESIKKDFYRLVVPYLLFAGIKVIKFSLLPLISGNINVFFKYIIGLLWASSSVHTSPIFYNVESMGFIWFLPALFCCKNIYNTLNILTNSRYFIVIFSNVIACASILIDRYIINLPFGILTGGGAIMFYMVGHLTQNIRLYPWCHIVAFVLWIVTLCSPACIDMASNRYYLYPAAVLGAFSATVSVLFLSRFALKKGCWVERCFVWLGQNSLLILCVHFFVAIIDPNTRLGIDNYFLWCMIDLICIIPISFFLTKIIFVRKIFN